MYDPTADADRPTDDDVCRLQDLEARLIDALPVIPVVCRQLNESTRHVEQSVVQVCGELQAIADKAQESVTRGARDLDAGQDGRGVRQLAEVAAETIGRMLERAEGAHGRLTAIAGRIDGLENRMLQIQVIVEEIDRVALGLKILSLNAQIEAARAGRAGAAFAVVAGETGKVAHEAGVLNKSIKDVVGQLTGDVRLIAGQIRERVSDGQQEVGTARSEVGGTLRLLGEASDDLRRSVEETTRDAKEVARMIGRSIVALQFQDAVSQRVGHAVAALTEVETDLAAALPGGALPPISAEREERLTREFTMDAERAVLGGGAAPAAGNVELF